MGEGVIAPYMEVGGFMVLKFICPDRLWKYGIGCICLPVYTSLTTAKIHYCIYTPMCVYMMGGGPL